MRCPFCRHPESRVIDSRASDDSQAIRRRRECPQSSRRFTPIETASLQVVKRSGALAPFSREKIIAGVGAACPGRPVGEDDLALLAQQVEESIRSTGVSQIHAHAIGLTILDPLRRLDTIAYLRFASVYSNFETLEDFEEAIAVLRRDAPPTA